MSKELKVDRIKCLISTKQSYPKTIKKKIDKDGRRADKIEKFLKKRLLKHKDCTCYIDGHDYWIYSSVRGVTFVMKDIVFKTTVDGNGAQEDIDYLVSVINKADESYDPQTYTDVEEGMYLDCFSTAFDEVCTEEDTTVMIQTKQEAKRTAKSLVRHKYRIGDKYATRRKTTKGDVMGDEVYEVKKFIYTIGDSIVNTVVMKQLCGKPCQRKPLTTFDCMTFHIKYEPSLFVFSMNVRFFKLSDEEASNKIDKWEKSLIGGAPKVEHKDSFGEQFDDFEHQKDIIEEQYSKDKMLLRNKVSAMTNSIDERELRYEMEKNIILANEIQEKLENLEKTFFPNKLNANSAV